MEIYRLDNEKRRILPILVGHGAMTVAAIQNQREPVTGYALEISNYRIELSLTEIKAIGAVALPHGIPYKP